MMQQAGGGKLWSPEDVPEEFQEVFFAFLDNDGGPADPV